MNKSDFML